MKRTIALAAAILGAALLVHAADPPTPKTAGPETKPSPEALPADTWVDLVALVAPGKHKIKGNWRKDGDVLKGSGKAGAGQRPRLRVPISIKGSYELEVQFVRRTGSSLVGVVFPVGPSHVSLLLSDQMGKRHALSHVKGKGPIAKKGGKLRNAKLYTVEIEVVCNDDGTAQVAVDLDGNSLFRWKGPQTSLAAPASFALRGAGSVGLAVGGATEFPHVKLKLTSGTATIVEKIPGATPVAPKPQPKPEPQPTTEHGKYYYALSKAYMDSNWPALKEQTKLYARHMSKLSQEQRKDVTYIRKESTAHPPAWWKSTSSSRNITFTAKIWGRSFKSNYIPSGMLGAQGVAEIRNGRLMIVVTWQPQLIDNPDPVEGKRAKAHKLTKGDFAECIVWHELGHNYVTEFLPASQVIELYNNYYLMFGQLQEFFADMTSLYHSRPKARKCILFMRLPSLVMYYENDPHTRAAYGIGSILLNEWLKDPENIDKVWPHIHLPATVPAKDIERNVLAYVYYHWDPRFSVAEDIRFRELIKSSLTTKKPGQRYTEGERILRSKGTIELSDGLQFKFMPGEDRPLKAKRDAWVKQQLQKAIKAGKTDTKAQAKKIDPWELISSPEIRSLIGGGM